MADIQEWTYLDNRVTADEMGAAADRDASVRPVRDLLAPLHELPQVTKLRRPVRVGEQGILAPRVPEPVRHGAAFAPVPLELHNPHNIVQAPPLRELQHDLNRPVPAPVTHDDDLVPRNARRCTAPQRPLMRAREPLALPALPLPGPPERLVKVLDRLVEREGDALLLIVRGDHDADQHGGGLDGAGVGDVELAELGLAALREAALGEPRVVPAGELADGRRAVGRGGLVGLFGGEGGAGFRGDVVEGVVDLVLWLASLAEWSL